MLQEHSHIKKRYANDNKLAYLFLCLLLLCFLLPGISSAYADCNIVGNNKLSATQIANAEKVRYKTIYDGDTIKLTDGRKIRFIGINTPEIGRKGKPSQAYAEKAREKLKSLLSSSQSLLLLYDKDKKDRYKRTLAYVYLSDGSDIQAQMLMSGLAMSIVVPPNDKNLTCYRKIENQARNQHLGIWKQAQLRPMSAKMSAKNLDSKSKQYRFVKGKITSVQTRSGSLILKLDDTVSVKLSDTAFKAYQHKHLLTKKVQIRGWVYAYHNKPGMTIHHPANFEINDKR